MSFDRLVVVDWSARSKPSAKTPAKDAIYICHSINFELQNTEYFRTRREASTIKRMVFALLAFSVLENVANIRFGGPESAKTLQITIRFWGPECARTLRI